MSETATWLELAVAFLAVVGIGGSLWAIGDDLDDLRRVKREGVVRGPRWWASIGYLSTNGGLLSFWLGYAVVAFIAVYLPSSTVWADIASSSRLTFGLSVAFVQVTQRVVRHKLRRLPDEAWTHFFGSAGRWRAQYHESQANVRRLEIEIAEQRMKRHEALNRETALGLRYQQLRMWLREQGIEPPPFREGKIP